MLRLDAEVGFAETEGGKNRPSADCGEMTRRSRRECAREKEALKEAPLRRRLRYTIPMPIGRLLIILGLVLVALGVLWPPIAKLGLGRLPGDIVIERDNFRLYLPLATSLIISAVLSILFWLLNR
jgi:Protein of unknown function (DUF2905)